MSKKLIYLLLIFAIALLPALATFAPVQLTSAKDGAKSYIIVLKNDPVVKYDGSLAGYAATEPGPGKKIDPASASVSRYARLLKSSHEASLKAAGVSVSAKVHDYLYALNGFSAILTEEQAAAFRSQKDVVMVLEDQMRQPQTDSSPAFLGLTAPGGAYDNGINGEGVVVGIIDTGIWPEHPSFADDGSYAAPPIGPLPCDFGNTAHNPNDAPFTCNNKLIGAYQVLDTYRLLIGADPDEFDSARDDDGHGTHTASTAAGNAGVDASVYGLSVAKVSGIAPRAHVVAYKGLGNLGGFTSDLAAAIDQAVADGVDVINYSIGGGAGAVGVDDIAFLLAADAGVFVAASAGNSGPAPETIGSPGTMPWLTTVGASSQSRFFDGYILLGNGQVYRGASLTDETGWAPLVDAATAGDDLCTPSYYGGPGLNPAVVSGKIVLCRRGAVGRADKSLAVSEAGGIGMILYNNSDVDNLFTDLHWVPSVHVDYTPGAAIKSYISSSPNPRARLETRKNQKKCDDPKGGPRIAGDGKLDCGPYTSKDYNAPAMTIFSSRGPTPITPDIIKPDVTAPGIQILAGNSPFPDPGMYPGELFQAIAGTSMSSPHVAGLFALLKQAHPEWSAAAAKSALMTTSYQRVRDNDRVSPADPFDMGAGHVNFAGPIDKKGSVFNPGVVYDAGFLDYFGFLCDAFPSAIVNPAATCALLESMGIQTKAYNLNYPSIGIASVPGTRTVIRTITSVAPETTIFKSLVKAPPGYEVTVEPSWMELDPGESGDFLVTVTNDGSAPVGEWRFGSLTWVGGKGYKAYSPIAVRGSLFEAPAEVQGSDASGSTSFDVHFGYTGAYSAENHGLIPATVTSDTVVQDPDQTFDPNDGYSNVHTFNLSGAALFRIVLPPWAAEANSDLDIYVYNPNGVQVASSTSGGTDEHVDISMPMDGAWRVYVHGWAAPGGDTDYDMFTWAIPLATGGSLNIDSTPASAVAGDSGTVQVSWAGLPSGWYLGAVSHHDASSILGWTLVSVDVP